MELSQKFERAVVFIKPDAMRRDPNQVPEGYSGTTNEDGTINLSGPITAKLLEETGAKLIASKVVTLTKEMIEKHYSHLVDKPFFPEILDDLEGQDVQVMILEGAEGFIQKGRKVVGATDPEEAAEGTLRKIFGLSKAQNSIHFTATPGEYEGERANIAKALVIEGEESQPDNVTSFPDDSKISAHLIPMAA